MWFIFELQNINGKYYIPKLMESITIFLLLYKFLFQISHIVCNMKVTQNISLGLPNTPEVTAKLKELIQDNQNIKTVIKGFDDETLKYIIDIPHVREQITEAGLC